MKQNKTRASRKSNVTSCMKNPYPILLLLPLLFLLSGCNAIAIWLYGLDTKFVPAHDDNREKVQARFGLEGEPWYELDETSLTCYLMDSFYTKLDTTDSLRWERQAKHLNNHLQMLQAMYFDRAGRLVSYHLNCYAEGFPNLKWNKYGAFNSFPPSSAAPPDTLLPLPALLPHIRDTHDNPISATPLPPGRLHRGGVLVRLFRQAKQTPYKDRAEEPPLGRRQPAGGSPLRQRRLVPCKNG